MIVDIIIGIGIAGALGWGLRQGADATLPFAGFAAGAVLGTRLPLLVGGGLHSSSSLVAALPAALLLGALSATLVDRLSPRLGRRRLVARNAPRRRAIANGAAGALLAAAAAGVAVWILGPVASEVGSLRGPVERSTILARLDSVLAPAGPRGTNAAAAPIDNFPTTDAPPPDVPPADPRAETDPHVLAADRSVVKIGVLACGHGGQGSGWVVADSLVATAAHVVAAADVITVRVHGTGPARPATAIWFDPVNDFALLRVPALKGVPALPMVARPAVGASGAALGFPGGSHAIRRARIGATTSTLKARFGGMLPGPGFRRDLFGRLVTTFRAKAQPGISGGPIVDTHGRVLTTIFGGSVLSASGDGVPNQFIRAALDRAGPPVGTGACLKDRNLPQ